MITGTITEKLSDTTALAVVGSEVILIRQRDAMSVRTSHDGLPFWVALPRGRRYPLPEIGSEIILTLSQERPGEASGWMLLTAYKTEVFTR